MMDFEIIRQAIAGQLRKQTPAELAKVLRLTEDEVLNFATGASKPSKAECGRLSGRLLMLRNAERWGR